MTLSVHKSPRPSVHESAVERGDHVNSVYLGPSIAIWIATAVRVVQLAMVFFWPRAAEESTV